MPEGEGATSDFDLAELLGTFAGAGADGPLADLLGIDGSRARIRLVDGRRGVTLAANDVSATLLRTTDGLAFEGSGTLAWESGARTPLDIHAGYRRDDGRIRVEARLDRLPLNELAGLHPSLWRLGRVVVPASGAVRMESDVSGAGVSGSAEVTLGAGTLAATGVADLPIELAGGTIGVSLASGFDGAELVAALDLAGGSRLTLTAAAARSGSGYEIGRAHV